MQTILLAGGFGTRISEETANRPKPMVEIGGRPILCHIMNIYAARGFRDFIVACGYRADVIKSYFHNLHVLTNDWVLDFRRGTRQAFGEQSPDWQVTIVDTGLHTQTAGRVLRLKEWTGGETFMVTYGDGVADLDVRELVAFQHEGFWQPMETLREKQQLETLWESGRAPWKLAQEAAASSLVRKAA